MPRFRPHRRGFTLVELLVCIVVVSILAGMIYAGASMAIKSANTATAQNNLRQLAMANINYSADRGTYCPAQSLDNNKRWHGGRNGSNSAWDPNEGYLSPYMGDGYYLELCPLLSGHENTPSFEEGAGGYGYNAAYVGGRLNPANKKWDFSRPNRPTNIQDPSKTLMFTTTAFARGSGLQEYPYTEPPSAAGGGYSLQASTHFRASGGRAVVAWCDGSVTLEEKNGSTSPEYYGGDSEGNQIGWFGPMEHNGYWNPQYSEFVSRGK